jgi:hypothetical protein
MGSNLLSHFLLQSSTIDERHVSLARTMLAKSMHCDSGTDSVEFADDDNETSVNFLRESALLEKVFDVKYDDVLLHFGGEIVNASLLPAKFLLSSTKLHIFAASREPKSGYLMRGNTKRWFVLDEATLSIYRCGNGLCYFKIQRTPYSVITMLKRCFNLWID